MIFKWLGAVAVIACLSACTPSAGTPPPPPANAEELTQTGAYDQRIDDVTQELRDVLELPYGPLEIKAYKVPPPTSWQSLSVYYRAAFTTWDAERNLPESIPAANALAWSHDGDLFAIALIDQPVPGEHRDYKILIVATNPS